MSTDTFTANSTSVIASLKAARIVPVVVLDDADQAVGLADALVRGGITSIEVTLRTAAGLGAIERLADRTDLIVGAGTVLNVDDADRAVSAGARFLVSPGYAHSVVARAREHNVGVLPGTATASEIQAAVADGLDAVKLFPAGLVGGLDAVAAFAGPFPQVRFMPSGGVTAANAAAYLAHPSVFAVGGSWMVPRDRLAAGDWSAITELSRAAIEALEVNDHG